MVRGIDLRDQNTASYDQTKRMKLYSSALTSKKWYEIAKQGTSQDIDGLVKSQKIRELMKKYKIIIENSVNIAKWLAADAGYNPEDYADIDAVMNDGSLVDILINSPIYLNIIEQSVTAFNSLKSSNVAVGKYVAMKAGLNSTLYADMDAIIADSSAMDAVANSSEVRNFILNTPLAWNKVKASNMAIGKYVAGEAGLDPSDYVDMDAVAASETAMNAIFTSKAARTIGWKSPVFRDKMWRNSVAVKELFNLFINATTYGTQVSTIAVPDSIVNIYNGQARLVRSNSTGHEWWDYPDFSTQIKTLGQQYYEHVADFSPDLDQWIACAYGDSQTQYILNASNLNTVSTFSANVSRVLGTKTLLFANENRAGTGIITVPTDPDNYDVFHTFFGDKILNYQIAISFSGTLLKRVWVYNVTDGSLVAEHDFTNDNIDVTAIKRYYGPEHYETYYFPMIGCIYNPPTDEYGFVYSDSEGIWVL